LPPKNKIIYNFVSELPPAKNLKSSNPKGSLPQAGGAGVGGILPALQILGEICSNFFERTPHL